jgi:hypothetical protein
MAVQAFSAQAWHQRKAQKLGIRSSVDRFGKTMDKA